MTHDFRMPEGLRTERLLVRAARPGDGAAFRDAVLESLPELTPWLPWARGPNDLDHAERVCTEAHAKFLAGEDLMAMLFRLDDGTFVGGSGLHRIDWRVPSFEIGYWVRTSQGGRGYVTEAVRALTAHAFGPLQAKRVHLRMDARNTASRRVAERAGFEFEGCLRRETLDPDGRVRDTLVFSRITPLEDAPLIDAPVKRGA